MKKIYTLLLIASLPLLLGACKVDKYYNSYSVGIWEDTWVGADEDTYAEVAQVIISRGHIPPTFTVEGDDVTLNDATAIKSYELQYQKLVNDLSAIEELIEGKGTDGKAYTITFRYSLNRSSQTQWSIISDNPVTVKVAAAP